MDGERKVSTNGLSHDQGGRHVHICRVFIKSRPPAELTAPKHFLVGSKLSTLKRFGQCLLFPISLASVTEPRTCGIQGNSYYFYLSALSIHSQRMPILFLYDHLDSNSVRQVKINLKWYPVLHFDRRKRETISTSMSILRSCRLQSLAF